jgi:antitoxin Phd
MKTVTATEVKNKFGTVMDIALAEPVMVKKSGRSAVVMLSAAEYSRLLAIEDAYWATRALRAEAGGFVSGAELTKLIEDAQGA